MLSDVEAFSNFLKKIQLCQKKINVFQENEFFVGKMKKIKFLMKINIYGIIQLFLLCRRSLVT